MPLRKVPPRAEFKRLVQKHRRAVDVAIELGIKDQSTISKWMKRYGITKLWQCGEQHPKARLTEHDVRLIWALQGEGLSGAAVARKFDVSPRTVCDIWNCRTWYWFTKNLPTPHGLMA